MNEARYQNQLIKRIEKLLPGCLVLKNDPRHIQGLPDLLVLYKDKWAALEVKVSASSEEQPNQRYYVDTFTEMSYASFIFPENEEEVLDELQHAFGIKREARLPQS